jgi:hypothetical protein
METIAGHTAELTITDITSNTISGQIQRVKSAPRMLFTFIYSFFKRSFYAEIHIIDADAVVIDCCTGHRF